MTDLVNITTDFAPRLGIDALGVGLMVGLYYWRYKHSQPVFTFFMFNLVVFVIAFMLKEVDFSLGTAFGLFAVFSLLRYRTEDISAKDMTYLLVSIALGLISSSANHLGLVALLSALLIGAILVLDGGLLFKPEASKVVEDVDLELTKPENRVQLIAMLQEKTGYTVHRISITRIELRKNRAIIRVYYYTA